MVAAAGLAGRGINEPTARRAMELAQDHEYLTEQRPDQLQDFVNRSPLQALRSYARNGSRVEGAASAAADATGARAGRNAGA